MSQPTKEDEFESRFHERIATELNIVDADERYDQMLDECSESCSMCESYGASRILKEIDPIAYNCGFNDWLDSADLFELDGSYYEQSEVDNLEDDLREEIEQEHEDELNGQNEDDPRLTDR